MTAGDGNGHPRAIDRVLGHRRAIQLTVAVLVVTAAVLLGLAGNSLIGPGGRGGVNAAPVPSTGTTADPTQPPSASTADRDRAPTVPGSQGTGGGDSSEQRPVTAASPKRIEVPSIGVETSVMGLGLTPDRTVEVPPFGRADEVGWYTESPTPGATGPSVLIGHVDSPEGPAVFAQLTQLADGARVHVHRSDESVAVFEVDRVQTFRKREFPTQDVYGDVNEPALRLITCGGQYDRAAGGYQGNTVAFAELVDIRNSEH